MDDSPNIVKVKEAVRKGLVPVSYSSLFRMASDSRSPFSRCFLYLGGSLCLDLDEFFRVGKEQAARKRGVMNDGGA